MSSPLDLGDTGMDLSQNKKQIDKNYVERMFWKQDTLLFQPELIYLNWGELLKKKKLNKVNKHRIFFSTVLFCSLFFAFRGWLNNGLYWSSKGTLINWHFRYSLEELKDVKCSYFCWVKNAGRWRSTERQRLMPVWVKQVVLLRVVQKYQPVISNTN